MKKFLLRILKWVLLTMLVYFVSDYTANEAIIIHCNERHRKWYDDNLDCIEPEGGGTYET